MARFRERLLLNQGQQQAEKQCVTGTWSIAQDVDAYIYI
jgi:hypothetical protein